MAQERMAKEIKVVICVGTACHVMGGSELFLIKERLEPAIAALVTIEGTPCLDRCRSVSSDNRPGGGAPFALVDGVPLERATLDSLAAAIIARALEG
ncbi:MAG: hypothetical protein RBT62_12885 [Spirochaetia bacterium]|nr:hypothetical protein [Spirochaetia bacterium]